MKRKLYDQLISWKSDQYRKPLILEGARQVGKTWLIKEFGKNEYNNVVYINCANNDFAKNLFVRDIVPQRIIRDIVAYTGQRIIAGETLIVFDEIQDAPNGITSLKYFCENAPEYAIIAAGSLLGVAVRKKSMTVPVGKVQTMSLYPLTFREFLRAADPSTFDYIEQNLSLSHLPEIIMSKLTDSYRRYMVCGGMPEAVIVLLENRGMQEVDRVLGDILYLYQADFSKYASPVEVNRITALWQSLPSQLSKENRKFLYNVVRSGARAREYEDGLFWLEEAGLIYRLYNVSKPGIPLSAYRELSAFKVYALDCGLLRRLARLAPEVVLSGNEQYKEFRGAMAENMVLQALVPQLDGVPYYWTSGNQAEIEFLIEHIDQVIPVEVKSATRISGGSLASYTSRYNPSLRVRLSMNNLQYNGGLISIPLPLADWILRLIAMA